MNQDRIDCHRWFLLNAVRASMCLALLAPGTAFAMTHKQYSCQSVVNATRLVDAADVVLLGELHGTFEGPEFAANMVCLFVSKGHPVVFAVEQEARWTEALNALVSSAVSAEDVRTFMRRTGWVSHHYGNHSHGTLHMLKRISELKRAGADIVIEAFDTRAAMKDTRPSMGERLAEIARTHPRRKMIVLGGELHMTLNPGASPSTSTAGEVLRTRINGRTVVALSMAPDSGYAWNCQGRTATDVVCGTHARRSLASGKRNAVELYVDPTQETSGVHGIFYVGETTAALPATLDVPIWKQD